MPNFNANANYALNGMSAPVVNTLITDNLAINAGVSVPAAQPATLTTRTSGTVGTLTMTNTGHGIITGQRIDLYWTGGQVYNVTVGTVAGTSVPITLTNGTLPVLSTAVTVGIATQETFAFTGNNLSALLLTTPNNGFFVLASSAPADLANFFVAGNGNYTWYTGSGVTNPVAGVTVATIWMSHNNTAGAVTMQAGALAH